VGELQNDDLVPDFRHELRYVIEHLGQRSTIAAHDAAQSSSEVSGGERALVVDRAYVEVAYAGAQLLVERIALRSAVAWMSADVSDELGAVGDLVRGSVMRAGKRDVAQLSWSESRKVVFHPRCTRQQERSGRTEKGVTVRDGLESDRIVHRGREGDGEQWARLRLQLRSSIDEGRKVQEIDGEAFGIQHSGP